MTKLSKQLRILVAGAVIALGAGVTSSAYAGSFQVTPSGDGIDPSLTTPFTADSLSGTSSTLIQAVGSSGGFVDYVASGYIDFSAFNLNSVPKPGGQTGLNGSYGLYAVFQQAFVCPGGLATGVTCAATGIQLSLYANPGDANNYTPASLTGPAPTDSKVSAGDILLGTADAVVAGGVAGINVLGGAFENVNTDFTLTSAGSSFFTSPVPFYTFAFSEYNNTSTGLACNTTACAVNFESGLTDFNNAPEPASLAIFGLGLAGVAALRRKKSV